MLLRDLTKPLNNVEVSVENKWLPGIVFSPRPVAHPSHLVQIAIMQVPPRLIYVPARSLREPEPVVSSEPPRKILLAPRGVMPPSDVLIPKDGAPYMVMVKFKNKAACKVWHLSFLFLHQGKPAWSTPMPLGSQVPPPKERLLVPTSALITKATPYADRT